MSKELSEMTLEELWELKRLFSTEFSDFALYAVRYSFENSLLLQKTLPLCLRFADFTG